MAENKMEQVAAMFGKQLGEPFNIKVGGLKYTIRLTEDGMETTDDDGDNWFDINFFLSLLSGRAVIVDD